MKKATENMKEKRPHWHQQGKDGPNSNGNAKILSRPDIKTISTQKRTRKE